LLHIAFVRYIFCNYKLWPYKTLLLSPNIACWLITCDENKIQIVALCWRFMMNIPAYSISVQFWIRKLPHVFTDYFYDCRTRQASLLFFYNRNLVTSLYWLLTLPHVSSSYLWTENGNVSIMSNVWSCLYWLFMINTLAHVSVGCYDQNLAACLY
jgi:hypothetical protein